jgi:hypothetical protein
MLKYSYWLLVAYIEEINEWMDAMQVVCNGRAVCWVVLVNVKTYS